MKKNLKKRHDYTVVRHLAKQSKSEDEEEEEQSKTNKHKHKEHIHQHKKGNMPDERHGYIKSKKHDCL